MLQKQGRGGLGGVTLLLLRLKCYANKTNMAQVFEAIPASDITSDIMPEEVFIISLCFSPAALLSSLASAKLLSHF